MGNLESKLLLFDQITKARFQSRPNRFLIQCELDGQTLSALLPNPGRLYELLLPGRVVHLIKEKESKDRKTHYTAVAVDRDGHPIMLNTHHTNDVFRYLLQEKKIPGLEEARILRSEIRMGRSRFDFLLKENGKEIVLEVKSCTLVGERVAMFPDAVTERGSRHLKDLASLSKEGIKTAIVFIVHWPFAWVFMPNYHTDLSFSQTLLQTRSNIQIIPVSVGWEQNLSLSPRIGILQIPWNDIEREAKDRGSYFLILNLKKGQKVEIGKLGKISFKKGFYIYVGSAMANLSKRMERHRHIKKQHHWHIDELRAVAEFHSVLPIRSSNRLECEIAKAMSEIAEWSVSGFGSTDCSCEAHLFGMSKDPLHSENFLKLLQYFRMDRFSNYSPSP